MDQLIFPDTGDYTATRCYSLQNPVYLRLQTPLGSYWGDPTMGSRLHELAREKDVPRVYRLAQQYAEQALQLLLDNGRASAIVVTTQRLKSGWLLLLIDVTDNTGTSYKFRHPVRIS